MSQQIGRSNQDFAPRLRSGSFQVILAIPVSPDLNKRCNACDIGSFFVASVKNHGRKQSQHPNSCPPNGYSLRASLQF